jgi:hypothetical protein
MDQRIQPQQNLLAPLRPTPGGRFLGGIRHW